MSNLSWLLLAVAALCAALGFGDLAGPMIGGLAKATLASLFIAYFISRVFGREMV